ncbi:primosomal protein N' [Sinimarinibacterium flocculans]|uniref:Replication restart protein PriA n=1 Tax=Sinimarinibacterium flocculans TaxID=985250 RepID=A0A318E6P5_9GAMM|nr:primosomal protein N' [Sinimarinibacterium flocculans]PXV64617.1 replication restart DNA helicase PriA [Sinimarinibacterium flocculans]
MLAAAICLPVPLRRSFDYRVDAALAGRLRRGCRVRVPFGRRTLVGVVVGAPRELPEGADELRDIEAVLDDEPPIPAELLALCEWAADYYLHPLGEVLAAALPAALRRGAMPATAQTEGYALTAAGRAALETLPPRHRAQRSLLQALSTAPRSRADLVATAAVLRRALDAGWIEAADAPAATPASGTPTPTPEQAAALDRLAAGDAGFAVHLLEGVTGSGKTELYLRRIEAALAEGRQALLLAPEISLTPQLDARLRERFGDGVHRFHSTLTDRAREQVWLRARDGRARIVVGTRSAVWLPFARLGLIVVDEEHDTSYKQQDGFRYSARDVAILRAQRLDVPVLLGTATPSLESLHNARSGRYRHIRLQRRVHDTPPPQVRVLDVRGLPLDHGLSPPLLQAVDRHLDQGGQALLFLNRRGYAPVLLCHACGWNAPCTHCDAHLTLHRGRNRLICHHCGAQQAVPRHCPSCSATSLIAVGAGTERIEQALANRFPQYRVARFDSDRITSHEALERQLADIRDGRTQILVGTQILAKGHDFPGLSLVGIVSADQALYGTDFRAVERMGQLVTQVAGRAGRAGQPGEVWLQTHEPEHPLLQTLARDGYGALCDALLAERRDTGLPPYAHLALLRAEAREAGQALRFLQLVRPCFEAPDVTVYEPLPSGMERRAGLARAQLLLQSASRAALHRSLGAAVARLQQMPEARRLRWSVDVDPYDLM